MAAYEDFLSRVLIEAPGCSEIAALLAIKDVCIEFCEKSLVLVRDHTPITLTANITDYNLSPPAGTLVTKVMRAWVESKPIDPIFPDAVGDAGFYNQTYGSFQAAPSIPRGYFQKSERVISVWPMPDKTYTNGLTLRVALKPTRASTTVDDVLFEDYADIIAKGTLSALMVTSNKPYTNVQLGAVYQGLFRAGINTARQRSSHGHVRSNLRVQARRI